MTLMVEDDVYSGETSCIDDDEVAYRFRVWRGH